MTLPLPIRYADTLRYDRDRGSVLMLDWRAYPQATAFLAYGDAESIALAISADTAVDRAASAYLAGYGLALVARAWADRPSDVRRSAIIQAAEQLRGARPADHRLAALVAQALASADAAILAGGDAEAAIIGLVGGQVTRADRVAERCGRIAAALLDEGDSVLTSGWAGPALIWMLHTAATEQAKPIKLFVSADNDPDRARMVVDLTREIGVAVTLLDDGAAAAGLASEQFSVFFAGAERIALDGAVIGDPAISRYAALARQHGIPRYILGYQGPDPSLPSAADLPAEQDSTAPELISAIITSRGLYRPEMIARYLNDGDALLDVIPLSLL